MHNFDKTVVVLGLQAQQKKWIILPRVSSHNSHIIAKELKKKIGRTIFRVQLWPMITMDGSQSPTIIMLQLKKNDFHVRYYDNGDVRQDGIFSIKCTELNSPGHAYGFIVVVWPGTKDTTKSEYMLKNYMLPYLLKKQEAPDGDSVFDADPVPPHVPPKFKLTKSESVKLSKKLRTLIQNVNQLGCMVRHASNDKIKQESWERCGKYILCTYTFLL